jgi:hypothetical protein
LFSPHFGAALQMLKLEIGGGGFSSDGSEPSVEPAKGQLGVHPHPDRRGRRGSADGRTARAVRYSPLLVSQTVADDMVTDPSFGRVVSVLGVHDSCGLPTTGYRCVVAAPARTLAARTGKLLWESELGATPATGTNPALPGPGGLARALDDAYDQAGITGILVWPLIDAIPPDLPHENRGLVWADRPWDGYYQVTPLTWVIAQTTQFTAPGWRFAAGANGTLPAGGSYETYLAPGRSAWSMVAQTSVAGAAQQITVRVSGGRPGYIYTFTTTTGQSRAGGRTPLIPVAGPMPIQYTAVADGAGLAKMLAPVDGSFGYVHGVLTQTAAGEPVE